MVITTARLAATIAALAGLVWLGHRDTAAVVTRMDGALNRMDRAIEHMDHAVERIDRSAAVCHRADACSSMADPARALIRQEIARDRPQPGPAESLAA